MARIRYLKPDFFGDEHIASLPFEHRLSFAGLWCLADREGRLEDSPPTIKRFLFSSDLSNINQFVDMDKILNDLTKKPFIIRYQVDEKKYIQVLNFLKHQLVHHTEKKSIIPPPSKSLTVKSPLKDGEKKVGMGNGNGERVMGIGMGSTGTPTPAQAALKEIELSGFNIYQCINKLKKDKKWRKDENLPDEVILKVCAQYWKQKPDIKRPFPWFTDVLNAEVRAWGAAQSMAQGKELKNLPIADFMKDLISGLANKKAV